MPFAVLPADSQALFNARSPSQVRQPAEIRGSLTEIRSRRHSLATLAADFNLDPRGAGAVIPSDIDKSIAGKLRLSQVCVR
jgi:hypothetical protein